MANREVPGAGAALRAAVREARDPSSSSATAAVLVGSSPRAEKASSMGSRAFRRPSAGALSAVARRSLGRERIS